MREHLVHPSRTSLRANLELSKGAFYSPIAARTYCADDRTPNKVARPLKADGVAVSVKARTATRFRHQPMCRPPLMLKSAPVAKPASSVVSQPQAEPISSARPSRLTGIV